MTHADSLLGNIKIESPDGLARSTKVTVGGLEVDYVQDMTLRITPETFITADVVLCGIAISSLVAEIGQAEISNIKHLNDTLKHFGFSIVPMDTKQNQWAF